MPTLFVQPELSRWLLRFFLLLLIWLPLPFANNRPEYWWPTEIVILSLIIAWFSQFTVEYIKPNQSTHAARVPLMALAFICLWVSANSIYSGLSTNLSYSPDIHATQSELLKTLCYLALFFLTLTLVTSRRKLRLLAITLVICGTFQAVYGSLMTLSGTEAIWFANKESYIGVATGTFINRNHLAGYLEMSLAMGIGLLIANLNQNPAPNWREMARRWIRTLLGPKARLRICLALMVIGLILTRSRMGNTAFFASMMIAGLMGLYFFRRKSRNSNPAGNGNTRSSNSRNNYGNKGVIILLTSLLLIDVLLMGTFFGIDKLQQRLATTSLEEQRITASTLSLGIIKDNLWTGTGPGTYYTAFPQYRDENISLYYDHAHNDYVEFLSEFGLIGTLPLALLVIHSFITAIRVQIVRRSRLMKAMGFSSCMAIIAIMLHSLTDFNLQIMGNAGTFMVILAIPYVALTIDRKNTQPPNQTSHSI